MDTFVPDLRHAIRRLRRTPAVTLVAILTLAVGIGAATTIFSVVYAALLRPLPFEESDRLAMLYATRTTSSEGTSQERWSRRDIMSIQPLLTSFDAIGSFTRASLSVADGDAPEQLVGEIVSPGYLTALGATPTLGRLFLPEEDTAAGTRPIAIVSARLWERRFASDRAIVGRRIAVNAVPVEIVGVLPRGFAGLSGQADVWVPAMLAPQLTYPGYLTGPQHFILLIGRLKRGVSFAQADAEIAARAPGVVSPELPNPMPPERWSATVVPLAAARIDPRVRRSSLLLAGAAALVLLISCVNVASLLLAHARTRRREIAIRLAIGCGRARIVQQLLVESLVLAACGGAAGTLIATWAMAAATMPDVLSAAGSNYVQVSAFAAPSVDPGFLAFAVAATAITSVLFGFAPAIESSRPDLVGALKEDARTTGARRGMLPVLVVSEVALAIVLLAGAGLLLRSLSRMMALGSGVTRDRVVSFWVNPPTSRYPDSAGPQIAERVLERVRTVPGVEAAAVNRCAPYGTTCARALVFFLDRPATTGDALPVERHYVSADYFRVLGVPLRMGRVLRDDDRLGRPPVTVINETAARRFWPGQNPIGQHVRFTTASALNDPRRPVEVVGVVGDVKYGSPDEPTYADFYTSALQFTYPSTMVFVKMDAASPASIASLRAAIASVDPTLPLYDVHTLDERAADTLSRPRFNAVVVATFAGAALFLAAIGVYGVMAYSVSTRMREMGIRIALGADPRRLVRLVVGEGLRLAGAGALIGVVVAIAAMRLIRTLLFGVTPTDPVAFGAAAIAMIGVALIAAIVPARRASRTDPIVVLRSE